MSYLNSMNLFDEKEDVLILYHGSYVNITPTYGLGNPKCDYGLAFYCTEDIYQAKLWAVAKTGTGYVYKFKLDTKDLNILKISEDNVLLWLAILMSNRELDDLSEVGQVNLRLFLEKYLTVDISTYDIIIGYRADDSYFKFASAFIEGALTYEYLVKAIKLGSLGYQVAIKSKRAFDRLIALDSISIQSNKLKSEFNNRDRIARNTYSDYASRVAYDRVRFKNNVNDIYKFL